MRNGRTLILALGLILLPGLLRANPMANDWFNFNFNDTNYSKSNLDSQVNLDDYPSDAGSNIVRFSLAVGNGLVTGANVPIRIIVKNGKPSFMAIVVDNTNFAHASWVPFNSNVVANLGPAPGPHEIWVGARSSAVHAPPTWKWYPVTRQTNLLAPATTNRVAPGPAN